MQPNKFPLVSRQLLEALAQAFPDKLPRPNPSVTDPAQHLAFLQGQQAVIDFLVAQERKQNPMKD